MSGEFFQLPINRLVENQDAKERDFVNTDLILTSTRQSTDTQNFSITLAASKIIKKTISHSVQKLESKPRYLWKSDKKYIQESALKLYAN